MTFTTARGSTISVEGSVITVKSVTLDRTSVYDMSVEPFSMVTVGRTGKNEYLVRIWFATYNVVNIGRYSNYHEATALICAVLSAVHYGCRLEQLDRQK